MSPKEQSRYMKSWTEAYAEVRAKTEEQMGPTGVVLELSHEDWEKMQNGATLEELKSVKEYDQDHADFYAGHTPKKKKMTVPAKAPSYQHGSGVAGQSGNTGDNEKRDKIQRARERLAKAQREDVDKSGIKKRIEIEKAALRDAERNQNSRYFGDDDYADGKRERIRDLQRKLQHQQ